MFTNDQFHEILFPQLLFYHKIAIIHNSLLTIYNNTPLLFGMKPMKSLTLHKKNQRSLTIEINPTPKQRLHHSNPKPRPDHQRSSLLNTTSYKNESSTTKHQPSKNFIRLKGDLNTVGLGLGTGLSSGTGLGLPAHIHKSFGDLKNDSLAKIISKRQPSVSKDSCPKIKQKDRKPRQRLSIDIFNKMSPDQKSYTNSTKAISRRRSTLISKMKSQVSQEFVDHSVTLYLFRYFPNLTKKCCRELDITCHRRRLTSCCKSKLFTIWTKNSDCMSDRRMEDLTTRKGSIYHRLETTSHIGFRSSLNSAKDLLVKCWKSSTTRRRSRWHWRSSGIAKHQTPKHWSNMGFWRPLTLEGLPHKILLRCTRLSDSVIIL